MSEMVSVLAEKFMEGAKKVAICKWKKIHLAHFRWIVYLKIYKLMYGNCNVPNRFTFQGAALHELPVVAIIDSGNKSLHAWIRIPDVRTFEEWKIKIEQKFFDQCLKPLGIQKPFSHEPSPRLYPQGNRTVAEVAVSESGCRGG